MFKKLIADYKLYFNIVKIALSISTAKREGIPNGRHLA